MLTTLLGKVISAGFVIGPIALVLGIGWSLFASRVDSRESYSSSASTAVARIWGGPLLQPHPRVQWRRADAATVELAQGDIGHSDVKVALDVDYRRRGVTELPCYEAAFDGTWSFTNPSPEASFVGFTLGLPVQRDALMLRDIRLLVDGREDAANTEYSSERIAWTGRVAGGAAAEFKVLYRARGMSRFGYTFADPSRAASDAAAAASSAASGPGGAASPKNLAHPVTAFRLAMTVRGARGELDYPVGSMSPTQIDGPSGGSAASATTLVWSVDRLLSAFDVGVELPDTGSVSAALVRLTRNAPFFYMLFAACLLFAFAHLTPRARLLHLLGLSAAYFLYFPLAVYLTAYLPWTVATRIALGGIGALCIVHAWRFIDRSTTVLVALDLLFFLTVPAMAYLVPAHTGLILVIAGFAVLGVGLHLVGVAAQEPEPASAPPPSRPPSPRPHIGDPVQQTVLVAGGGQP